MSKRKIVISYILSSILILFCFTMLRMTYRDKQSLIQNGRISKAVVVKEINRGRGIDIQYVYIVHSVLYSSWYKVYRDINVGDTIEIIYLPQKPSLSKPKLELEK